MGASGAISGVLGFYFLLFPRNTVRMLAFLPPFLMQVFEIPARFVLGMYLLFDNLVPFLFAGEGGVAHGAHIGGFIAGGLAAWLMDRRGARGPAGRHRGPGSAAAGRRRGSGGPRRRPPRRAARAYFALPAPAARGVALGRRRPSRSPPGCGRRATRTPRSLLLRRVVRDVPRGAGLAEAYALAGMILLDDRREPTAAYQYLLAALEMGPRPETAAAVRQELAAIEDPAEAARRAAARRRSGRRAAPRGRCATITRR